MFGKNNKAEKGAGEKRAFIPWGRDQTKVPSHGPIPTTAPQGSRSPQAPPSEVSPRGFLSTLGAQLRPQEPRAPVSSPLPLFAGDFSYISPLTCPHSWVCQTPSPSTAVSGSGCARDAPGVQQGWGAERGAARPRSLPRPRRPPIPPLALGLTRWDTGAADIKGAALMGN